MNRRRVRHNPDATLVLVISSIALVLVLLAGFIQLSVQYADLQSQLTQCEAR